MLEMWTWVGVERILRVSVSTCFPCRLSHLNGELSTDGVWSEADRQAMEFLPPASLRRIYHLQEELVSKPDSTGRALLSSSFPSGSGTTTPARKPKSTVAGTGSTATDLLLGVTGRNKLLAAGDKLRELIIPDVLAQAVSVVGQGVGVGPVSSQKKTKRDGTGLSEEQTARLKGELDKIVAAVCPLCEGSVVGLDKPFVVDGEGLDWEV
jgi:hypothetical protein